MTIPARQSGSIEYCRESQLVKQGWLSILARRFVNVTQPAWKTIGRAVVEPIPGGAPENTYGLAGES